MISEIINLNIINGNKLFKIDEIHMKTIMNIV